MSNAVPEVHAGGAHPVPALSVAMFPSPRGWPQPVIWGSATPRHPCCLLHCCCQWLCTFNAHYDMALGCLLKGTAHELSSDMVQWWLTLQGHPNSVQLQAIIQQPFTVFWVPSSGLWDPSRCRTCAVVGNSGWLKGSGHGLQIDGHDWVLRWVPQKGFAPPCLPRTLTCPLNLRPGVHLVLVPFKPLDLQWVASAFSTGELMQHISFGATRGQHDQVLPPYHLPYHRLSVHPQGRPSTCAVMALVCVQVSVFGFGADSEGNRHDYWKKNCWSGAFCRTRVHNTDVEFSLIER
uniref:Uncharacterized protein n=1 Tax=Falco tinnunculus TaxID=100819 RepID=A0A8C4XRZ6_FALTI